MFVDAASPEKRSMARVNPLLELEAKDRARAEAKKNKGKKNKKAAAKDAAPKKRKRRDLANEKAGNHLAIVSWIGEGKKDKVRRDRTFTTVSREMAWNTKPETACTAFPRERPRRCTWRRYKDVSKTRTSR